MQTFHIQFDDRFDSQGFFRDPQRRATLEAAGRIWESYLQESFTALPEGTKLSVPLKYVSAVNADSYTITTTYQEVSSGVPIDDLVIFVYSLSLPDGASTLGQGGPFASYQVGSDLDRRYNGDKFAPWAGTIYFNNSASFFFDATPDTSDDIPANSNDFLSIALHEIGHVLGLGTAAIFQRLVGKQGFTGPNTLALTNGQPVPMAEDGAHIQDGWTLSGKFGEALMDPSNLQGTRKVPNAIDLAMMRDIGFITRSTPSNLFTKGQNYELALKDYDGNPHGFSNAVPAGVANGYKFQGEADVNRDGLAEGIFTNRESGRWATIGVDPITGAIDYSRHGQGGNTRVVGIYIDPLVAEGEANSGFLLSGEVAPKRFGPFDSQRRFQNDLRIDNLTLKTSGDFDKDGFQEVYWRVNDGTAYLRSIMHADGNIQYANYQNEEQMRTYLTATGNADVIQSIL